MKSFGQPSCLFSSGGNGKLIPKDFCCFSVYWINLFVRMFMYVCNENISITQKRKRI